MTPGWVLKGILLYFCAVHPATAVLPDSWEVRTTQNSNQLNGVGYRAGLFLAAGDTGTLLTSSNGSEWTARSLGPTAETLYCAAPAYDRYFVGGERALHYSLNGVDWINGAVFDDADEIHAIVPDAFVAVARSRSLGKSYILYSTNRIDWLSINAPTTNALFALLVVSPVYVPGSLWPPPTFIAVGERGTIIVSRDGINWMPRNSGTTDSLRALVLHQGRIFAGGESGVLLTSLDGLSWVEAAHLSFGIRGLASSGNAIVAVGRRMDSGRLHVSRDGVNWPGNALEIAKPLNAVTFGQSSFVAVGDAGLIVQSGYAQDASVNTWTNPGGGLWEEPFWSCERLPAMDQGVVTVTNAGSKRVEIGASTAMSFSNALTIKALQIEGHGGSTNELFLNRAGTNAPLNVLSWLTIGTNASLVSYSSALTAYEASISSRALFAENSWIKIGRVLLGADLTLSNSDASIGLLRIGAGRTVHQFEGSNHGNIITLDGGSRFLLERGRLSIRDLYLVNSYRVEGVSTNGTATFVQNGGETSFDSILFGMRPSQFGSTYRGEFQSTAGSLRAGRLTFFNGSFSQTGGTNIIDVMVVPERVYDTVGSYGLSGGTLISSNLSIGSWYDPLSNPNTPNPGSFGQGGGIHTNGRITLNGGFRYWRRFGTVGVIRYGTYHQSGGLLVSSNVYVNGGSFKQSGGTNFTDTLTIHESGSFVLTGGELTTSNVVVDSQYCVREAVSQRCFNTPFSHQEGTHVVHGSLELKQFASYSLDTGGLTARNIFIGQTAALTCISGGVTNSGLFTLQGGVFEAGNGKHQLGQLEALEFVSSWYDGPEHPGSLNLSGSESGVVRFHDSHDVRWSTPKLKITGWHGWDGEGTRLFIGTDASGLTEEQLSKVVFVNPQGWRKGEYPARIRNTGEVVPAVAPPLTIARDSHGLILSWPGEHDLFRATNIAGPFLKVENATRSATNLFSAPQQYFQLRSREQ